MKLLGRNLRERRLFLQLTQEEVAEKAGLQPSTISHFECGRRAPSVQNLVKLAKALQISADKLLG